MMNKNRDLGYLLEELKIQMIRGRGPWLVGRVSLEYEGKVIVASGKALELMLEKNRVYIVDDTCSGDYHRWTKTESFSLVFKGV
ncbi:hypothetical protein ACFSJQ_16165 [Vibrio olivae]